MLKEESNRRGKKRVKLEQLIELALNRETILSARGLDISEGGMRVLSPALIEFGTRVFVMFTVRCAFEDDQIVKGEAISVYCQKNESGYAVGFKFLDLKPTETELLSACLVE